MLGLWSADDVVSVVHEFGALILAATGFLVAWIAYRKSKEAKQESKESKAESGEAKTQAAVSGAKVDMATHRIDRVADQQNVIQQDRAKSIPVEAVTALLNATPGASDGPIKVEVEGTAQVHEVGRQVSPEANQQTGPASGASPP